jgi:hypothetical protein
MNELSSIHVSNYPCRQCNGVIVSCLITIMTDIVSLRYGQIYRSDMDADWSDMALVFMSKGNFAI